MTPKAADAPKKGPPPMPRTSHISQKRPKTQKNIKKQLYYVNGGTQERKFDFLKIFFHLHINGGTQEKIFSFVKKIFSSLINGGTQEKKFNFVKNIFRLYKREKIIRRLHERKIVK